MSIIATTGKGGVGKTTVAAMIIRRLVERKMTPVLAIDADSNSNLHEMLGIEYSSTVGGIREDAKKLKSDPGMSKQEYLEMQVEQAIVENQGYDFLAMGRPEGPGCYCYANNVLRDVIERVASGYKYLVIDCEAGLEHISRRTVLSIDHLLTVSDPSLRGLHTAIRVSELLEDMKTRVRHSSLIVNRIPDISNMTPEQTECIKKSGFESVYLFPYDTSIAAMDASGGNINSIHEESPISTNIDKLLDTFISDTN